MSFWITNNNGLLTQFVQTNACNYKAKKSDKGDYRRPMNLGLTI